MVCSSGNLGLSSPGELGLCLDGIDPPEQRGPTFKDDDWQSLVSLCTGGGAAVSVPSTRSRPPTATGWYSGGSHQHSRDRYRPADPALFSSRFHIHRGLPADLWLTPNELEGNQGILGFGGKTNAGRHGRSHVCCAHGPALY